MYQKTKDYALIWQHLGREGIIPCYSNVYPKMVCFVKYEKTHSSIHLIDTQLGKRTRLIECNDLLNFYAQCLELDIEFIKP